MLLIEALSIEKIFWWDISLDTSVLRVSRVLLTGPLPGSGGPFPGILAIVRSLLKLEWEKKEKEKEKRIDHGRRAR